MRLSATHCSNKQMPPYYTTCVEYYSPAASVTQIVAAFVVGYIISVLFNELFNQTGAVLHFDDLDVEELRAELQKMEGQRDRALRIIAILLAVLWLGFTSLAISNNGIGSLSDKTEL